MSKYNIIKDISGAPFSEQVKISQLRNIANELAEANRLKRLEIQLRSERTIQEQREWLTSVTEDRA